MVSKEKFNGNIMKFTFTDEDGDILASFRVNPTDVGLAKRGKIVEEYVKSFNPASMTNVDEAIRFNDGLEEKFCELLGYDARSSLFGFLSATTIMEDGTMFAGLIMDKITEAISQQVNSMKNATEKYTAKYNAV